MRQAHPSLIPFPPKSRECRSPAGAILILTEASKLEGQVPFPLRSNPLRLPPCPQHRPSVFRVPWDCKLTSRQFASSGFLPIAAMSSSLTSRAVLRQSRVLLRQNQSRQASTTAETAAKAKDTASQTASKAKETASTSVSKASEGLSKVTSSAGSAASRVTSGARNTLGRIGGRTGRLIQRVESKRSIGGFAGELEANRLQH